MHGAPDRLPCQGEARRLPSPDSSCRPASSAAGRSLHTVPWLWPRSPAGQPSCMSFSKFRAWQLTQYEKASPPLARTPAVCPPVGAHVAWRCSFSSVPFSGHHRARVRGQPCWPVAGPPLGLPGLPVMCVPPCLQPAQRKPLHSAPPIPDPSPPCGHTHTLTGAGAGHRHDLPAAPRRPAGLVRRRRPGGHPGHGTRRLPPSRCAQP